MKSKFLILFLATMLVLLNSSCAQISKQKKEEAQALINEAGNLMMNKNEEVKGKEALKRAIPLLKRSIEIDKTIPVAYESLINCYIELGDHFNAINICTLWLNDHPDDNNVRLKRGMLYLRTKDIDNSNSDFSIIAKSISKHNLTITSQLTEAQIRSVINLSFINLIIGNRSQALSLLEQLKKAIPKNKEVENAYLSLQSSTREERIKELTGL